MKPVLSSAEMNRRKYAQPPSWEQISAFIDEMGMTMYHFEKFFHIPFNTLTQVKSGKRSLSCEYWSIIYEKIKPAYGAGFLDDFTTKQRKNRINHYLTDNLTSQPTNLHDTHTRLSTVK